MAEYVIFIVLYYARRSNVNRYGLYNLRVTSYIKVPQKQSSVDDLVTALRDPRVIEALGDVLALKL